MIDSTLNDRSIGILMNISSHSSRHRNTSIPSTNDPSYFVKNHHTKTRGRNDKLQHHSFFLEQSLIHLCFYKSYRASLSSLYSSSSYKPMSKHSKNCTSSSVFTYRERQKLKGVYGTNESRIGQDSIKKFEMCTICNNSLIEPTCCDQGHMFCRPCVVQFLVKQKKKIAEQQADVEKIIKRKELEEKEKEMEKEVLKLESFEKYETFQQVNRRHEFSNGVQGPSKGGQVTQKDVKPIGIYELNPKKNDFVKTAFWTLENAPAHVDKIQEVQKAVYCPGSQHRLTLKKLRPMQLKQVEKEYLCWICSKQIKRQKIGAYKCGHLVCEACKSNKCEMCDQSSGWLEIQGSSSAFAAHNKSDVKTYSHAFVC